MSVYQNRRDIIVNGLQSHRLADSAFENYPLRLTPVPPGYSLAEFVTLLLDKCDIVVHTGRRKLFPNCFNY